MNNIRSIHFVGIKGVGMTPLAVIAKEAGAEVTGSDVANKYITDVILEKAGINVYKDFSPEHVTDVDLVITTGAHGGYENVEVKKAKEKNIPVMTQGEAVGYFMSGEPWDRPDITGISIAGCHGKTTTTAMIATIFKSAQKDPSYVIGTGSIPSLGSSGHYGKGSFFVAEADEYATEPVFDKTPKFLWQHPKIVVVTNIEYDHPDLYPTFESLISAYKTFIYAVLDKGGTAVVCGDDPEIQKIIERRNGSIITYGFNSNNTYVLSHVESVVGGMEFVISREGKSIGTYIIPALGEHNALNALAALIVAKESGLTEEEIGEGLLAFKGTKRRLEFVGETKEGAYVFDDYAHHPTEIRKTILSLKQRYPTSNIICVFQPHTFSRTKLLFDEFSSSFEGTDKVILTDIYASQREAFDPTISARDLVKAISSKQQALYLPNLSDVVQYVSKNQFGSDIILITMGAGDVYQIAYELVSK